MKKYLIKFCLGFGILMILSNSCQKQSFDELYRDPSKAEETTVDKQYAGIVYAMRELVVPSYWNYFVILRTTNLRYLQLVGWANEPNHLVPGAAATQDRWRMFYEGLAQFRAFEDVYNASPDVEKQERRIFYLTAKIFFYDQTQKVVDLHGDIPWSKAGLLNQNGGNYMLSYAPYDKAEDIYKKMLDDLKEISVELSNITVTQKVQNNLKTQDIINGGSLDLWKKYCNSLRIRMLMRVSKAADFSNRSQQEISEIVNNPSTYPLLLSNNDNIQIDIFDNTNAAIHARGFRDGLESQGWYSNIASKEIIDHMNSNNDPRKRFMFEPGVGASGEYIGLDQSLTSSLQNQQMAGSTGQPSKIAIYNRSTFSRNQNFPGVLLTASEVQFLLSEYYLNGGNTSLAKSSFEKGIKESISMIEKLRSISNDNSVAAPTPVSDVEVNNYITKIGWGTDNLKKVASQKWLHFNIIQPIESWAENRRLDYPLFSFRVEAADIQKEVPKRWNLPSSEPAYNPENYSAVKSTDNLDTKLFWDVN
ncbi:SusD/RagB family nutrient-binding outer membrane lipoprotein [Sphingobacterium suaedae]|uniref:SusD/RagB family nutrient-binding outer membrane lipoprotein n=1 Tax=Sphingobacterium suaedae TaxID=1686402 RepID=A0ABW5KGD1_9SPHI